MVLFRNFEQDKFLQENVFTPSYLSLYNRKVFGVLRNVFSGQNIIIKISLLNLLIVAKLGSTV